ncbi:DUF1289 domain-containing protein [Aureimonas glaciei]|uniref:DUF1289 domain-containing protein n=1 Tax=Aureimonas glaciei TaxID=1776957 RepID=A0A916Y7B0_9HYPH|nr:DUF1289 domain-containing protein [Aureimonas glaciei]GGD32938.1 hypothetical protein GCM10011335_39930 [Aureimonas glaciei]
MSDTELDLWADAPSPCVDVCKYKRQGRCVGCAMTKEEKQSFPRNGSGAAKKEFIETLMGRLADSTRNPAFWVMAYQRKCAIEGVPCPIAEDDEV